MNIREKRRQAQTADSKPLTNDKEVVLKLTKGELEALLIGLGKHIQRKRS